MIEDPNNHHPTITDEKLEEYLSIWDKLIEKDRDIITITLSINDVRRVAFLYTLIYGEEKRNLTYKQAERVKEWLYSLEERLGIRDEREYAS